MDRLKRFSCTC